MARNWASISILYSSAVKLSLIENLIQVYRAPLNTFSIRSASLTYFPLVFFFSRNRTVFFLVRMLYPSSDFPMI